MSDGEKTFNHSANSRYEMVVSADRVFSATETTSRAAAFPKRTRSPRGRRLGRAARVVAGVTTAAISLLYASADAHAQAGPRVDIRKGPYLQHLTDSSVEVRLELSAPATASLELSQDDGKKISFTGKAESPFQTLRASGLSPSTHYKYVVRVAGGASDGGELRTAPKNDAIESFDFLIYGDNRSDPTAHASVVRAMAKTPFDFLVHSGDFVVAGGAPAQWQEFFEIEKPLLKNACVFACVGNHELFEDSAAANYARYFGPSEGEPSRLYGSYRWGSARFFLLNAFESWDGDERVWLEKELARADNEPGLAWRFVVLHYSPWSGGPHGDNKKMLAAGIDKLLEDHKVDLAIAGHDHIYERGIGPSGLKYLISGGGGAPLYRDIQKAQTTRKIEAAYNFVRASVTGNKVSFLAERVDGSILDRCGFGHDGSWDCDTTAPSIGSAASKATTPGAGGPNPASATPEPRASSCGCRAVGGASTGGARLAVGLAALVPLPFARRRSPRRGAGRRATEGKAIHRG